MENPSALIVIDVQSGLFDGGDIPYKGNELLKTINELIEKARISHTPIIIIQHNGEGEDSSLYPNTDGWQIHPALGNREEDVYVQKSHPDSFQDTSLQKELESRGIRKLIVAGLQTEYCIDTTCRRAYSLGYEVILIENGHSTYDSENLSAELIIAHHNQVLSSWFVTLEDANEIAFPA